MLCTELETDGSRNSEGILHHECVKLPSSDGCVAGGEMTSEVAGGWMLSLVEL
jgi:hypothetical protein